MKTDPLDDRPRRDDLSAPAGIPLTEREKRYRTLFGAMEEGFCVVEMVFDEAGRSVDYRFLEFNDAFERMTGISAEAALAGRSARELYPTLEEFWFETYGRVAATGESVRFENGAEAMGKWFEVHAFRIGGEGSREVGILFKDVSERRGAEVERERLLAEAQAREAFLDLVTDRLPVRVGYLDADFRYRYMNGEYERAFGLKPGEGVGKSVAELAGEGPFRAAEPFLRRALAGEANFQSFWVEYEFGRRRVEVNYIPDPAEGGVVVHVTDVTERYETEERLRQARARRDRALENAEVATFDYDVTEDRVYANALLARFFGVSEEDAQGGSIARYLAAIHPDDRERVRATIGASLASGERYEAEYRLVVPGVAERTILARGDALSDDAGRSTRLSGVAVDITERVRAEAARRSTLAILEGIIEGTSEAMVAIDCDYRFLAMNEAFRYTIRHLFGVMPAVGGDLRGVLSDVPEDRAKAEILWARALAGEEVVVREEFGAPDRARVTFDLRFYPIRDAEGRIVGAAEIARDVTARAKAEAERERLLRELEIERGKLQKFFELAPAFIAVMRGRDLVFEYVNDAYYGIVGHRPIVGLPLAEALPELVGGAEGRDYDRLLLEIMDSGTTRTFNERPAWVQRTPRGPLEERFLDLAYLPLREADGTVSGVLVHGIDVTEGVLARRRVEESEAKYRNLFTSMNEGYCVAEILLDGEGKPKDYRFLTVNEAFERLTGIPLEAARAGRTIRELVPEIEPFFIELYGRVALTGMAEEYVQHAAALDRWYEGRVVPFGEPGSLQVAILFEEITEAKRAEIERERLLAELADEREKLDTVLRLAPAFVTILRGRELRFEYANPAYLRLVGGRPTVGLTLAESQPEVVAGGSTGQEFDKLLLEVMDRGEARTFTRLPVRYQPVPGGPVDDRVLDFVYQPLRDREGNVTGVLAQGTDVTERAQAEREIAEREELFRTVFEQAPDDAILVMDLDRTLTAWNPAAERITGWSAAEAIGRKADLIFTPEDREANAPLRETAGATIAGKAIDERWYLRKDGSRFWGSGTMNALHDEEGRVRGFLKVFRDATERYMEAQTLAFLSLLTEAIVDLRDADAILETSERMLGHYLGASRVTFGEIGGDGDTLAIRKEWGPDVPSILGTMSLASLGPRLAGRFLAGTMDVIRDAEAEFAGDPFLEVLRATQVAAAISVPIMKEGRLASIFVVHADAPRAWDEDEVGLVQQVADRMSAEIERARAEAGLRASEERFRQLVDLSPATVWFGEPDGGLSYISQDFYEATGLSPETALPNGWTSVVHPDDLPGLATAWEAARKDEALYDTEFRVRYRDGEYRWLAARAVPLRDREGRVTGWLGSNTDIQVQKETEETLRTRVEERTAELQAAVREAEGFNYSISHDLRAPLRAMVATATIVLEEAGPELMDEHREMLVRQAENAKRLGQLIDELLRLSRLARVAVNREPLDMTRKTREVIEELAQSGGIYGCRFDVQEGMTGQGDRGLVRTVLQNLVGNACKFSPNGGTVRIGQQGDVYSVSDEGVGFDMQFAPKIFLPFERLVTETEFPGTGIGLANVKRIVERHGGRVWVESEPGKGTTFFFTLGS